MNQELENRIFFVDCKRQAIAKIKECYYHGCSEKSINSHILQKNGILSMISSNNHLWRISVKPFKSPPILPEKVGINKIFSFRCFCNKHDSELFHKIEGSEIDFNDYHSRFLFIVRTFYYELYKKELSIYQFECLIKKLSKERKVGYELKIARYERSIEQMRLAIEDLDFLSNLIWKDINSNSESFIFQLREIERKELIVSSFFEYETTKELYTYKLLNEGREIERLSPIFIALFPYKSKSILLMGYAREDKDKVKGYVKEFFNDREKRLERKLTNLVIFQCENWVCSDKFYRKQISGNEEYLYKMTKFSTKNFYERKVFDLNIFRDTFKSKVIDWEKRYGR